MSGMPDVFCPDADFLLLNSVSNGLRHHDAQRSVGHVENATGAPVVVFVWHACVDGAIGFNVDDVADFVDLEQRRDGRHSILAEWASEHVTRSATISL